MQSLSSLFCLQRQYLGNDNNAQFVRGPIVTGLSRLSPRAINNVVWTVATKRIKIRSFSMAGFHSESNYPSA